MQWPWQRKDEELDAEIRQHLAMAERERTERGESAEQARLNARREFGNVGLVKEVTREMWGWGWLERLLQDLRFGLRMLRKQPGFALIAILTLALGIGANTAIFSVVNAVLLKPLPYREPQQLVWVAGQFNNGQECYGARDFLQWREQAQSFTHLAAYEPEQVYLTGRGEPEQLDSVAATANLFPALGVAPLLGRAYTQEEERPTAAPVVILSHAFWQRRFGGDASILGQALLLDGKSRQVIGVMPPEFRFLRKADVLLPHTLDVQKILATEGMRYVGNMIGRLKPGVTPEQARAELNTILQRLIAADRDKMYSHRAVVTPLGEQLLGKARRGLLVLFGTVAFVLLIACVNVANLLLARASTRQKEMALRAALGAGRWRLIRQMLTESSLLALCGGTAGLWLAWMGVKALMPLLPEALAHLKTIHVDNAALGFTFLATLLTGLVAGLVPALQTSQIDLNEQLKEGTRGASFAAHRNVRRVSPVLVVAELALTMSLLVGAGLLGKSYRRLRAVEPGYNPRNLLTMQLPIYTTDYKQPQRKMFYQDLLARLNALPGVEVAALGPLPLRDLRLGSSETKTVGDAVCCYEVSAAYFRTLGLSLLAGRGFTEQDQENTAPVAIINATEARRDAYGGNAIGKPAAYGRRGKPDGTIVGVVNDVKRYGLDSGVQDLEQYISVLQSAENQAPYLLIRTVGEPAQLIPAIRQQVWALNSNLPIVDVMTMEERLSESIAPRRFQSSLLAAFAVLALMLALVGVYGVMSYAVSRQTHEIGIRMALGAQARNVMLLFVRQGLTLTLLGIGLGLAVSFALTRWLETLLFGVRSTDPATYGAIASLFLLVALVACWLPAHRATKVDPLVAVRHE